MSATVRPIPWNSAKIEAGARDPEFRVEDDGVWRMASRAAALYVLLDLDEWIEDAYHWVRRTYPKNHGLVLLGNEPPTPLLATIATLDVMVQCKDEAPPHQAAAHLQQALVASTQHRDIPGPHAETLVARAQRAFFNQEPLPERACYMTNAFWIDPDFST